MYKCVQFHIFNYFTVGIFHIGFSRLSKPPTRIGKIPNERLCLWGADDLHTGRSSWASIGELSPLPMVFGRDASARGGDKNNADKSHK